MNFMRKVLQILLSVGSVFFCACSEDEPEKDPVVETPKASLAKKWETGAVFKVPESVLFHPKNNILYVSNVNGDPEAKDGNGFISKLSVTGTVETLEWVTGLDAPKGMAVFSNTLYVADITNVKVIDIDNGKIIETIALPDASFLNDIVIDANGVAYISDTGSNTIYKIDASGKSAWLKGALDGPNGLHLNGTNLYIIEFNSGKLYSANTDTKALEMISAGYTEGDGIVRTGDGQWLISSFNGSVNFLDSNKATLVLVAGYTLEN
jgi:DNA-binding beta-propeller fold protein YncE